MTWWVWYLLCGVVVLVGFGLLAAKTIVTVSPEVQGYEDYVDFKTQALCPYPMGSQDAKDWFKGCCTCL